MAVPTFDVTIERMERYSTTIQVKAKNAADSLDVARRVPIPESKWTFEAASKPIPVGATKVS